MKLYVRVRRACMVDGMSTREAARVFGLHRDTVRKMLQYSVPPGYRRQSPPRRPKLDPYRGVIDRIMEEDRGLPKFLILSRVVGQGIPICEPLGGRSIMRNSD